MKKIKEKLSKNNKLKFILGFISAILFNSLIVNGSTLIAGDISYDNRTSKMNSSNIQNAIDELYTKANSCPKGNSNIVKVMKYSTETADKCITGDESTCQEIIHNKTATYQPGTIVKYKVNSSTTRTFYVLHDDGGQLTLQDRENIVNSVAWYADNKDNTHGPTTALEALETATLNWSNVVSQTYTMGTTNFNGTNAYTGCTASSGEVLTCDRNSNYGYTLASRTAKARMITAQETSALNCKNGANQSCPVWMNNYLNSATSYGATNEGIDFGYWTMSADSSNQYVAWAVYWYGFVNNNYTLMTYFGVRPVIVINK